MNILLAYNIGLEYFRVYSGNNHIKDYIKFDSKNIITKFNLEEFHKYQKWIKVFGEFL